MTTITNPVSRADYNYGDTLIVATRYGEARIDFVEARVPTDMDVLLGTPILPTGLVASYYRCHIGNCVYVGDTHYLALRDALCSMASSEADILLNGDTFGGMTLDQA